MVLGTCVIPGTTAVCSKNAQRRTTQHRKTKGKSRQRTMPRCTAELYMAGLTWAGAASFVIQQRNMYKLINCTGAWYCTSNVTGVCELVKVPQIAAPHGAALCGASAAVRFWTELQGVAGHGTARRCAAEL